MPAISLRRNLPEHENAWGKNPKPKAYTAVDSRP